VPADGELNRETQLHSFAVTGGVESTHRGMKLGPIGA
jgi:hypothetical protein